MAGTQVYMSINADEAKLGEAVIALKDNRTWMIMGPDWRLYAMHSFRPMPAVSCPVVDLALIADEKAVQFAISNFLADACRDSLISRLISAGAAVMCS
jgi:hypothetical protein